MNKDIEKIIDVANKLVRTGRAGGSTSERIAAAFVLNRMAYLPSGYEDVVVAWDRLDTWQHYVRPIRVQHMDRIEGF